MLKLLLALLVLAIAWTTSAYAHARHAVFVSGSAVTTTSATASNVTGLSWPVLSTDAVWFRCKLSVTSQTSTSRVRFDLSGPSSTAVRIAVESYDTASTVAKPAEMLTALSTLSAVGDTPTTATITTLEGVLRPSANGTYQVRFASETAGQTSTVEIGSWCEYSYQRFQP